MSRTDASRFTDAASVAHRAVQPIASRTGRDNISILDDPAGESVLTRDPGPPRPGTTDGRRWATSGMTGAGTVASRSLTSQSRQLSAGITSTLSAELEGRVSRDLVADIVRAVVDESRQSTGDRAAESLTAEARQRLERFIRAGASR